MAGLTPDEIAKQFTAYYQPIVDLNTSAVAGFEALARVVQADGSIATAGAVIEEIEGHPDALQALIRTILVSIRRDMVPLFECYQPFYVSVNNLGRSFFTSRCRCRLRSRLVLEQSGVRAGSFPRSKRGLSAKLSSPGLMEVRKLSP